MKETTTEHPLFDPALDNELNEIVKQEAGLVEVQSNDLQIQYVSPDNIDELDDFEAAPLEMSAEYWTPFDGETRKVLFIKTANALMPDFNDKNKMIEKESVFMLWKDGSGAKQIYNASARLVGVVRQFKLQPGAALQVTYTGKMKNKSNNFSSDSWAIFPLIPKSK